MPSRASSLTPSTSSSSDTGEIDITHLDNVYQALMSTILDVQPTSIPPQTVDGTANGAGAAEGEEKDAGAVKNAKRRKMDKKRAKREEQKLAQEESVDAVEFKLFSRKPVKLVSLLPAEEPIWTTRNPRHVPLTDEQMREMRRRVESVVVDGVDMLAPVSRGPTTATRRVVTAEITTTNIIHLAIPRPLPPFSSTFFATHSSSTTLPLKAPKASAGHGKKSTTSGKTSDPVVEALKRTRMQKRERGNVHVLYTTNGKIRPPGKQQDSVPTCVPLVLACEGETKVDKAHLRRLARRAVRMGHLPTPPNHPHAHLPTTNANGTSSSKTKSTSGPWVNPYIPPGRFWSAPEELGGKSGGYAYGFAGSAVGVRGREEGRRRGGAYVRDRMR